MQTRPQQLKAWRRFHAQQLKEALAGPHGATIRPIINVLDNLTPRLMPMLLVLMRTRDWRLVNANTRFVLLHEINSAITKLREQEGKVAIDDPLPGEEPTLFILCRDMLSGNSRENPAGDCSGNQKD